MKSTIIKKAEEYVLGSRLTHRDSIRVSTENVIFAARALVCEKKIDKISIFFEKEDGVMEIPMDEDGRLLEYPKGFCEYMDQWLMTLVGWK